MSEPNFKKMWEYNYNTRKPKYTMRGKLLPAAPPVAALVCMCPEIDNPLKPLKIYPVKVNWATGLVEHSSSNCGKPLLQSVLNCNGCFEDFWGAAREIACIECLPYM